MLCEGTIGFSGYPVPRQASDQFSATVGPGHLGVDRKIASESRRAPGVALAAGEPMKHDAAPFDQVHDSGSASHTVDREDLAARFGASFEDVPEHLLLIVDRLVETRTRVETYLTNISCPGRMTVP